MVPDKCMYHPFPPLVWIDVCQKNTLSPSNPFSLHHREPLIGFKGIASGDVGVNSLSVRESDTKASAVSSGLYTWYQVRRQCVGEGAALGLSNEIYVTLQLHEQRALPPAQLRLSSFLYNQHSAMHMRIDPAKHMCACLLCFCLCFAPPPPQEPNALDVGDQRPAPGAASMTTIQDCLNGCNTDNE
jgi:hypothetical protein